MRHKTNWERVVQKLDELDSMLLPAWAHPVVREIREQVMPFIEKRRSKREKAAQSARAYRATPDGHRKHTAYNRMYQLKKKEEKEHGIPTALSNEARDQVRA